MKISILMPIYDCPSDLLLKAIKSITSQSHQDWEILIRDGCLNRPAIENPEVKNLLDTECQKIVYYLEEDGRDDIAHRSGVYTALNWGMRRATGDIFSFQSGDDERGDSEVLACVNERFEKHGPSPFLIYGDCDKIRKDGSLDVVVPPGQMRPVSNPITYEEMMQSNMLCTPAVFWNRAVIEKFGYFDETYDWAADIDYWLRIWKGIDKEYLPQSIGKYRDWEVSGNVKNTSRVEEQAAEIWNKYGRKI